MKILEALHQDHINLARLLDLLDEKVLKIRAGASPDFALIADVIDYISNYADGHHHPRENVIYAYFLGRTPELDALLSEGGDEHRELRERTDELVQLLDEILNDTVMPMDDFALRLAEFVSIQRQHLDVEEAAIFPQLDIIANDADWKAIETLLPVMIDPLFGRSNVNQYIALYRALESPVDAA